MPCLPDRGSWLPPGASADAQLAGLVGELAVLSVSALLVARMGARAMERSAKDFCDAVAAAAEEEGCGRARAEASDASGGDRESTSANACASLTDDSATLPQLSHAAALHLQQSGSGPTPNAETHMKLQMLKLACGHSQTVRVLTGLMAHRLKAACLNGPHGKRAYAHNSKQQESLFAATLLPSRRGAG
eukprot:6189867-Pleurochrysis_carterae.AAC.1